MTGAEDGVGFAPEITVARFLDVSFDDLLLGSYQPGACPKCGHKPHYMPVYASDFGDEHTVVEGEVEQLAPPKESALVGRRLRVCVVSRQGCIRASSQG